LSMDAAATKTRIYRDPEEAAGQAAGWLHHLASASTGQFSICVSGGRTPKLFYQILARPPYLERFPWRRVHWFWGDERFVPPSHRESNYRMVREVMLDNVPVAPKNIHPIQRWIRRPPQPTTTSENFGASMEAGSLCPARLSLTSCSSVLAKMDIPRRCSHNRRSLKRRSDGWLPSSDFARNRALHLLCRRCAPAGMSLFLYSALANERLSREFSPALICPRAGSVPTGPSIGSWIRRRRRNDAAG
jgi:hypothetical protein